MCEKYETRGLISNVNRRVVRQPVVDQPMWQQLNKHGVLFVHPLYTRRQLSLVPNMRAIASGIET